MIIFLYGPDSYRLKQNSNIVLDNFKKKHPSGTFFKFDLFNSDDIIKLEDAVKSGSLFDEVKLIVVKNLFSSKTYADRIGELIKGQNLLKAKDTVLLFVENQEEKEIAKSKGTFNLLTEKGNIVRNIGYLEGERLVRWLKDEVALRQCSIESDATKELTANVGNESWALVNEVDKLCNFKAGGVIKREDVILLGFKKIDLNIFNFVDTIAGKNKTEAYEILFKEIKNGRDPYYLLTMMIYGFRNLLTVKDLSDRGMSVDSITKKLHLHPFVARKTCQKAKSFKLNELQAIYKDFLFLDTSFKNGTLNLEDSLFNFILN